MRAGNVAVDDDDGTVMLGVCCMSGCPGYRVYRHRRPNASLRAGCCCWSLHYAMLHHQSVRASFRASTRNIYDAVNQSGQAGPGSAGDGRPVDRREARGTGWQWGGWLAD